MQINFYFIIGGAPPARASSRRLLENAASTAAAATAADGIVVWVTLFGFAAHSRARSLALEDPAQRAQEGLICKR
jgi:hypothetical protein